MAFAGPLIGPAFALEGYAFFIEAIFLGLYLYGWERLSAARRTGGAASRSRSAASLSGVLVLAANAWMQHPVGFRLGAGRRADRRRRLGGARSTRPGRRWPSTRRCRRYQAVGFAAAGDLRLGAPGAGPARGRYARLGLRSRWRSARSRRSLQPLAGDLLAKRAHQHQPAKLAAMEGQFETERRAPLRIGGWPDLERARDALRDRDSRRPQLPRRQQTRHRSDGPRSRPARPSGRTSHVTHLAFQVMVGAGGVRCSWPSLWYWLVRWRRRGRRRAAAAAGCSPALVACAPLGFLALEAGWVVTEAGRQPWVIYGVMRTADAVTPVADVWGSLALFTALYAGAADPAGGLPAPAARRRRRHDAADAARARDVRRAGRLRRARRAPTSAAGSGICSAAARARVAQRAALAQAIGPGLGGQPRLADLPGRAALHLLSRRPTRRPASRCSGRCTWS